MKDLTLQEEWAVDNLVMRRLARWCMIALVLAHAIGWTCIWYFCTPFSGNVSHPAPIIMGVFGGMASLFAIPWWIVAEYEVASDQAKVDAIKAKNSSDEDKPHVCKVCATIETIKEEVKEYTAGSWKN